MYVSHFGGVSITKFVKWLLSESLSMVHWYQKISFTQTCTRLLASLRKNHSFYESQDLTSRGRVLLQTIIDQMFVFSLNSCTDILTMYMMVQGLHL